MNNKIKLSVIVLSILLILIIYITITWLNVPPSTTEQTETDINKQTITLIKHEDELLRLAPFFKRLEADKFVIKPSLESQKISFYDCKIKQTYIFDGAGIQRYYIRRSTPINSNDINKVYPDFMLMILTFSSSQEAAQYAAKIGNTHYYVRSDDSDCFWFKAPWKVVSNGKSVFYLHTRAEMLRDFTEKYGNILQNMNESLT